MELFSQLKALEEQQARWQKQKAELEQRAQDGEERADKLERCIADIHHKSILQKLTRGFSQQNQDDPGCWSVNEMCSNYSVTGKRPRLFAELWASD